MSQVHGCSLRASKGVRKLDQVAHGDVNPVFRWTVCVVLDVVLKFLRSHVGAPGRCRGNEEHLVAGEALETRQGHAVWLSQFGQADSIGPESFPNATVISDVLPLRVDAIEVHACLRIDDAAVLLDEALGTVEELLPGVVCPPVPEVAFEVELAACTTRKEQSPAEESTLTRSHAFRNKISQENKGQSLFHALTLPVVLGTAAFFFYEWTMFNCQMFAYQCVGI